MASGTASSGPRLTRGAAGRSSVEADRSVPEREEATPMPPRRRCGATEVNDRLAETYASFRTNQDRIQRFTEPAMVTGVAEGAMAELITIPVVVHVVYRTD